MELQTICKRLGTLTDVFDGFDEQPIDCDFVLPDYLPDITAVLKCMVNPVVQSHRISGDRITADGTAYLQVLYLDEERRCVYSYEHAQPFTSTFTVKDLNGNDVIRLSARVNYVNCRATGPRRVDIHGAFSVDLKVKNNGGCDAVSAVEDEGLFARGCMVSGTVVCSQAEKAVSINEVVDLGPSPAECLVRNEAAAVITECRRMAGKAVVKGTVQLHTVYVSDRQNGVLCHVDNSIPFGQILDVDGLTEEQLCDCRVWVTQCDARLMQDPGGENRLLSVALKLTVALECYETDTHDIITDAYHTRYALATETKRVEMFQIRSVCSDTADVACVIETPEDAIEIVDLWCDRITANSRCDETGNAIVGEALIGMIVRDSNGALAYYERSGEYHLERVSACETLTVTALPTETTFVKNATHTEVRLRVMIHGVECDRQSQSAVVRLEVDETAPCGGGDLLEGCCLKVCFASAGESIWELARRERTSPEAIKAENGLTQDMLEENTMLLIPMR